MSSLQRQLPFKINKLPFGILCAHSEGYYHSSLRLPVMQARLVVSLDGETAANWGQTASKIIRGSAKCRALSNRCRDLVLWRKATGLQTTDYGQARQRKHLLQSNDAAAVGGFSLRRPLRCSHP